MKPRILNLRAIDGPSLFGPRQLLRVELADVREHEAELKQRQQRLNQILRDIKPGSADFFESDLPPRRALDAGLSAGQLIADLAITLQRWVGFPVSQSTVLSASENGEEITIEYAVQPAAGKAINLAVYLYDLAETERRDARYNAEHALAQFTRNCVQYRNVTAYLRLARHRDISWHDIKQDGHYLAFGQGHLTQRVYGGFTENTSLISSRLSTDKHVTAGMLLSHGIPAPSQHVVTTLKAALQAARSLGYPVVIKPLGTDKGTAVSTGLMDDAAIEKAYSAARAHGPVLIESHLPGEHYRLTVMDGKLRTARHQIPARVTGDGKNDITRLIELENIKRAAQNLWPIKLDENVDDFIRRSDMSRQSIPAAGETIPLRSQSNLVLGGSYENVTAQVHPDNKWLAERATHVMGIDVAGLDFLCPDITKSYLEVGGGFCEINVTPAFMFDEREYLFDKWFTGQKKDRILTIGVLDDAGTIAPQIAGQMLKAHPSCSWASKNGFYVDGRLATKDAQNNFAGTRRAWTEPSSTAALMELNRQDISESGLGIDRLDVMVIGKGPEQPEAQQLAIIALLKSLSTKTIEVTSVNKSLKETAAFFSVPAA